jgi:hypothetical protein
MVTLIKESMPLGKPMERECIHGVIKKYTMESGLMAKNKDTESGEELMETVTSVSGKIIRLRAMEFILGLMGIDMRASGFSVLDMAKALISSQMEMST